MEIYIKESKAQDARMQLIAAGISNRKPKVLAWAMKKAKDSEMQLKLGLDQSQFETAKKKKK